MKEDSTNVLQGWLLRLNAGDPQARAEFIRRACGRQQWLVRRMLGDFSRLRRFEDTDDVMQTVVIRVMHRLEAARPPTVLDFFRLGGCRPACACSAGWKATTWNRPAIFFLCPPFLA
ncbi:MAG: hypothetical protein ACJ8F7_05470 [Gemmataceae bacterium]